MRKTKLITLSTSTGMLYSTMFKNTIKHTLSTLGYNVDNLKIEQKKVAFEVHDEKYLEFECLFKKPLTFEQKTDLKKAINKFRSFYEGFDFTFVGNALQVIYCAPGFVIPKGHPNHLLKTPKILEPKELWNRLKLKREVIALKVEELKTGISIKEPVFNKIDLLLSTLEGASLEKLEGKVEQTVKTMKEFYHFIVGQKIPQAETASSTVDLKDMKPVIAWINRSERGDAREKN